MQSAGSPIDRFYAATLQRLVAEGRLDLAARTLVVAGGDTDRRTLLHVGFTDVVVSNLDDRDSAPDMSPYAWMHLDAEDLDLPDGSFSQAVVHAGLHHCRSPHRALLEMHRVARDSIVVFEARDNRLMRLARQLGFTGDYELDAVVVQGGTHGGMRNGPVPNYVYRWTEREFTKVLASYDPSGVVAARYFYGLRLPLERLRLAGSRGKLLLVGLATLPLRVLVRVAPRQGNEFAMWAATRRAPWPWVRVVDGAPQLDPEGAALQVGRRQRR
ncbi:MAG: methyltransferase domain-containing protein [Actinomycetota bacterium]|nr:methyltransferase domain-containing protein [Actinomycetota bacterium]